MNHILKFEKKYGVDVGFHGSNIDPPNHEKRVGKSGMDKNLTLHEVIEIAFHMKEKPNILIKAGQNAKWYFKKIDPNNIDKENKKQNWRDKKRIIMYIIHWE